MNQPQSQLKARPHHGQHMPDTTIFKLYLVFHPGKRYNPVTKSRHQHKPYQTGEINVLQTIATGSAIHCFIHALQSDCRMGCH
jgi:hypothetical protein